MAKNFRTQLSGQIGESLVVAELGRRGIIAAAFAGNVPDIDILAYKNGKTLALQVKAWSSGSISVDATDYLNIEINGDHQHVNGPRIDRQSSLIYVFVKIGNVQGEDQFYILTERDFVNCIDKNYRSFLDRYAGRRPKNPSTTHCAVKDVNLASHLNSWRLIEEAFR